MVPCKIKQFFLYILREHEKTKPDDGIEKPDLMSADMYREMIRQKWEDEERQNMTNPDGPTHYANVQYNGKTTSIRINIEKI